MATTPINTRDRGPITFFVVDPGGYVYADFGCQPGTLGVQICERGRTRGEPIRANAETLVAVARKWNRDRSRA